MFKRIGWLAALGGAAGALYYAARIEPRRFDIVEIDLPLDGLDPVFDGWKVVQISDIHMNGGMTRERLGEIVAIINGHAPDVIVITGDFATRRRGFVPQDLLVPLRELRAKEAIIATLGNHDYKLHRAAVRYVIRESGLTLLNNAVYTIRRGEACLHFAGVESVLRRRARLDLTLPALAQEGAAILLAHEPDFAEIAAATKRFALQLSGHSHGGQIRVPILTRFALPAYSQRYTMGAYRVGKMMLYVNRGVGTVGVPLRFNCPPEITVFTLHAPPE